MQELVESYKFGLNADTKKCEAQYICDQKPELFQVSVINKRVCPSLKTLKKRALIF